MTIVICSLFNLCTLEVYIAKNMDPDQTALLGAVCSGFIVLASGINKSGVHLDICSRYNEQVFFLGKKIRQFFCEFLNLFVINGRDIKVKMVDNIQQFVSFFLKIKDYNKHSQFLSSSIQHHSWPASSGFYCLTVFFANSLDLDQAQQNIRPNLIWIFCQA